ncbi:single-stranded-DNA-specific exonuclease RecJ [Candidatus Pelagibacter sp.]|uniref:single-stranded-DNA-specific exonuclease RecJ n=1 Tax=Candidatus Pelagibacter sp. TaxID=2024849 RepID=UPI003F84E97C
MKSVSGKNWEELSLDARLIEKIKIDHALNDVQAKLVLSRNFSKEEIFLIRNKISLNNPFLKTKDFLSGIELLQKCIINNEKILIIGDYDVDGCVSTSLMVNFLKKNNVNLNYYIPDRIKDGYGASVKLIEKLIKKYTPKLIVFLDCGSNSNEALTYLNSKSIKSIIIDHHNTQKPYPPCNVFINPKKDENYKKFDYFCTAFLTYWFIDLFIKSYKFQNSLKGFSIFVLLATVADVMPMRDINKIFAKQVIENFDINKNPVIKYIFKFFKIKKKIEIDDLGYKIAPLFNSAGRIENANQIIELLTTNSEELIIKIINKINKLNEKRKILEKNILDELNTKKIENQKGVITIYKTFLHEGIIGIIASRIKDYFNKPCIVLTKSGNFIKGSARSLDNFNLGEYINKAVKKKILISGGGHNLAAGLSLTENNINLFKKFINSFFNDKNHSSKFIYDSSVSLNAINNDFIKSINLLGPYGNKNPNPLFLLRDVKIVKPKSIKNNFFTCFIFKNKKMIKASSFHHVKSNISYELQNSKKTFDLIAKIKLNKWNNKNTIEIEIVDLIKDI